ncbi:RecQ family ATP-dependent DNA helicase [Alteribacillus iranensis]|uniref:ATP-dependent DNA helicase RecQ n=1 Tax=Alteribacillus iranensis TaxID=930128 RepID=A0A1I1ZS40_9BACI|nr:ATP-dependent DNA helicase RecQ [Alteribacillus iranensis]SFE33280.1 ATP-dependent DNA helicase RecQ [Alteribacillus iranensis]
MNKTLESYLYEYFGYPSFRTYQREIITSVLDGKDVLAMLPTGTGKSLCYQLPALICSGLSVVISPLLSLMDNQVQELKWAGFKKVAAYNSFLSYQEKRYILRNMKKYKLLFISPESIQQDVVLEELRKQQIDLFAVDEAHCISQWGHEFRTDYLKLGRVRELLGNPPCLALTATAAPTIQTDINNKLQLQEPVLFYESIDRTNISLEVVDTDSERNKKETVVHYIKQLPKPGIIYASSRRKTEELARLINEKTESHAYSYHGGMSAEDRQLIQQQFISGDIDVMCCTNAFGMGINKSNIRFIIHYHYPKDIESYVQEIGRAGRDGLPSSAILLYTEGDGILPRQVIELEFPDTPHIEAAITRMDDKESDYTLEKRLIDECGWEEQHARFFVYYWKEWRLLENSDLKASEYIASIAEKRKQWKRGKLKQMEEWLHNATVCRREKLLHCFEETLTKRPERCCDICGTAELPAGQRMERKKQESLDWKARLHKLFFLDHD